MSKPIRVAVVGVGYLGRIHAKIYHAMDNVELVAVVDINQAIADSIANQYHCQALTSTAALESQIDAVSIVVPTSLHLTVARPFLEAGVHMLLEKPVASTVAESTEIVALARENKIILQVGHLERFNAGIMKMAELASNPRFIEVHRLGKFVERATDVDVITDLMIHDIDIVLSLIDAELTAISATGTQVITDHIDIANARLEFANGAVANVTASRVSRSQFRRIRVFSHDMYLGLNFSDQQLEEVKPGAIKSGDKFPQLLHRNIEVTPQLPLDAELAHFIDCVLDNKPPLVSGEDGLLAVKVAELVRTEMTRSMDLGNDKSTISKGELSTCPQEIALSTVQTTQEITNTIQESKKATQETNKTTQESKKPTRETIVRLLTEKPHLTRRELAEQIGITADGVKYHLKKLKAAGVIKHVGSTKAGEWKVLKSND